MSTRESVIQGLRAWMKAHSSPGSTLTDAQVIAADDDGPRPEIPYLVPFVETHGARLGHDEEVHSLDGGGAPQYHIAGYRKSRANLQGIGKASESWLEQLVASCRDPAAHLTWSSSGIVVVPSGPIRALPRMMNASREMYFVLPVDVYYRVVGAEVAAVPLSEVQTGLEQSPEDAGSATLSLDIDVQLP